MTTKGAVSANAILTRGGDMLKHNTDTIFVGREQELVELYSILMKMKKRNIVIQGRGGVGISSIVLGIQQSKLDYRTPIDIVGKRLFWLNTDTLFESGNVQIINDLFDRVRKTLSKTKDTVVVLEDCDDFIKAAQSNGCSNLINGIMRDLKTGKYQAIFEVKEENLGELLKCDADIREFCTLYEVQEPNSENLHMILGQAVKVLEKYHGIRINTKATEAAVLLTEKYKLPELRAQPDAAISLLDQALVDYCIQIHSTPLEVERLNDSLKRIEAALDGDSRYKEHESLSQQDLIALKEDTLKKIEDTRTQWDQPQKDIRRLYREVSDGEEEIRKFEDEIEKIRQIQREKAHKIEASSPTVESSNAEPQKYESISNILSTGGLDTPEIAQIKSRLRKMEELVSAATEEYKRRVTEIYSNLELQDSHVLKSFSSLSGIPVDKLTEDDRDKLRLLEETLAIRVIGQDEPRKEIAIAVRRSRLGLKMQNKPSGTFMFLGPSGVGKTELAKTLADALSVPLLRFDMSEYMERHAVAKLIGAPPGYEGYEHGGILTNAARRNPYSVVLFDEIEKAHADVFNLMLQLLDDARLTDSRGLTASFTDTIIIMTTNIGTTYFLDETLPFEAAKELALTDLREHYRPKFLGRFGGNIYCFQRLGLEVLTSICKKDLARINALIKDRGLRIEMPKTDIAAMIQDKYVVREGARSVLGFIDRNITSGIAELVLASDRSQGTILATYEPGVGIKTRVVH